MRTTGTREAHATVSKPRLHHCTPAWATVRLCLEEKKEKEKESKLRHPLWQTVWRFLRKLQMKLQCDPAVPLQCRHPKKRKSVSEKLLSWV